MSLAKQLYPLTLLCMALLFVLSACRQEEGASATAVNPTDAANTRITASATPNTPPIKDAAGYATEIEVARSLWISHHIDDYSLEIWYSQNNQDVQIVNITVAGGVVTDSNQSCYPERNCVLSKMDPTEFTIDNLFEIAASMNNLGLPAGDLNITFSKEYGYPTAIANPEALIQPGNFQPANP